MDPDPAQSRSTLISDPAQHGTLLTQQKRLLEEIRTSLELNPCLLDKMGRILCLTANEVHCNGIELKGIRKSLDALLDLYRTVNPAAALEADRLAKLRAEIERCCPPVDACEPICVDVPCEPPKGRGDGWSVKSRGRVPLRETGERHQPWKFAERARHTGDKTLPRVPLGAFVGQIVPAAATPVPQDFRAGGSSPPGAQAPVGFRTFTQTELAKGYPPDMSGARGGDVVLMSGNLWLKLSVDGGQAFTDLDFTALFEKDSVYGGWAGDQVVHYVPAIDCFILYVQSFKGPATQADGSANPNANKNVIKVALASQGDLKKFSGGKQAWWRQWDFTADDFGLGSSWLDFPDITYGQNFAHINTNVFAAKSGKLFFELPLADMQAGRGFGFQFAFMEGKWGGSPAQNVQSDDFYWAAHVDNSKMLIYSSRGGDPSYVWRERTVNNWPRDKTPDSKAFEDDVVSKAPDSADWISEDHRIIGATQVGTQLWFAWTGAGDDGGYGGFKFPHPHIQIAKFDISKDFERIDQMQVWNGDHAYAYASLTTNSDNEVGISLAWGGGASFFGGHAVGILGDFVVWYGGASDVTSLRNSLNDDGTTSLITRFGDYLHVRLAHPDTRYFSAFGYTVKKDAAVAAPEVGKFAYSYVEFGRPLLPLPVIK